MTFHTDPPTPATYRAYLRSDRDLDYVLGNAHDDLGVEFISPMPLETTLTRTQYAELAP